MGKAFEDHLGKDGTVLDGDITTIVVIIFWWGWGLRGDSGFKGYFALSECPPIHFTIHMDTIYNIIPT